MGVTLPRERSEPNATAEEAAYQRSENHDITSPLALEDKSRLSSICKIERPDDAIQLLQRKYGDLAIDRLRSYRFSQTTCDHNAMPLCLQEIRDTETNDDGLSSADAKGKKLPGVDWQDYKRLYAGLQYLYRRDLQAATY
ncbi:MAG: hypothetical protein Q9222_001100 [Ikaeria aurantiellina]